MLDKFNDFKKKDMLIESCGLNNINSCGGYSGNYSDNPSESELKEKRRRKIIKRREERF